MHSHRAWAQTAIWFAGVFFIGDMAIEFVDKWPHLGHITRDDKADIMSKRTHYVSILIMFYVSLQVAIRLPN